MVDMAVVAARNRSINRKYLNFCLKYPSTLFDYNYVPRFDGYGLRRACISAVANVRAPINS